jgi:hypothetical protein
MASPAGRGAQVRLDGDAQAAARGALGTTLAATIEAKRVLEYTGAVADGTTLDGSTRTGDAAEDELLGPAGTTAPVVILERVMAETLTATTIVAGAAAAVVQAASNSRKTLGLINTGANDAWFGWSSAVNASTGWPLYANGGGYGWALGEAPTGALYVYSTSGTTIIAKQGT